MRFPAGSISNRDIQLLYEYRILRQPADRLTAICTAGNPVTINELEWTVAETGLYQAILPVKQPAAGLIPFLEFLPKDNIGMRNLANLTDIEVTENELILYSVGDMVSEMEISIYWCYSLRAIDSLLTDILGDLERLAKEFSNLELQIQSYRDNKSGLTRPVGLVPNLMKIQRTVDQYEVVDALHQVVVPERNRLFVNYSQDNLNQMDHIFNESVEFRLLNRDHYVLEDFTAPVLLISGNGDLVLKNVVGQVLVTRWRGTLTLIDCPDVHLTANSESDICRLSRVLLSRNSTLYLENQIHQINEIQLSATSICRHWRANVRLIGYVGPGCTYWCSAQVSVPGRVQLPEYLPNSNTVYDFRIHDIIGTFTSDFDNMLIVAQNNLTTRVGNYDAEPEPTLYVPFWEASYNVQTINGGSS